MKDVSVCSNENYACPLKRFYVTNKTDVFYIVYTRIMDLLGSLEHGPKRMK